MTEFIKPHWEAWWRMSSTIWHTKKDWTVYHKLLGSLLPTHHRRSPREGQVRWQRNSMTTCKDLHFCYSLGERDTDWHGSHDFTTTVSNNHSQTSSIVVLENSKVEICSVVHQRVGEEITVGTGTGSCELMKSCSKPPAKEGNICNGWTNLPKRSAFLLFHKGHAVRAKICTLYSRHEPAKTLK